MAKCLARRRRRPHGFGWLFGVSWDREEASGMNWPVPRLPEGLDTGYRVALPEASQRATESCSPNLPWSRALWARSALCESSAVKGRTVVRVGAGCADIANLASPLEHTVLHPCETGTQGYSGPK